MFSRNYVNTKYYAVIGNPARLDFNLPLSLSLQFGRTEVIDNTLNPDFVRKFILDYFFEERENLRFDL